MRSTSPGRPASPRPNRRTRSASSSPSPPLRRPASLMPERTTCRRASPSPPPPLPLSLVPREGEGSIAEGVNQVPLYDEGIGGGYQKRKPFSLAAPDDGPEKRASQPIPPPMRNPTAQPPRDRRCSARVGGKENDHDRH